jgi:hypothetical protein
MNLVILMQGVERGRSETDSFLKYGISTHAVI